ncbi:transmembrane protein 199-like [Xenia sp. Carnegie-2017]|uniref:transmembrane protein 199-like n=1 Tax=Xenia sp. Carnegie-2017 TaxID=2897299 RepID=UPI001F0482BD|nr:transmembrane protein 199-like [Xenia sp. Carnegie-2017]
MVKICRNIKIIKQKNSMPVKVILTNRILDAIEAVFQLDGVSNEFKNQLQGWRQIQGNLKTDEKESNDTLSIPFSIVKQLYETLKNAGKKFYLHKLLEESGLYYERNSPPEKSPELIKRLQELQAEQNNLRYKAMVKNVDKELSYRDKETLGFEVRSTSRQLSSVMNFVLSVGGTFTFGFMCSQYAFTTIGLRIMFGIILASVVALAELYFMAKGSEF